MRINSRLRESATFDGAGAGEGLAVFFSQGGEAEARYRFIVRAITSQGTFDVGEFYSSPPSATSIPGKLTRMIAGAVCPGVQSWEVEISAVPSNDEGTIPPETAEVILTSSRCCYQAGVQRVAERYAYISGNSLSASAVFKVRAGMRITGIAAFGLPGGGTVTIGGGSTITVPDGISIGLQPEGSIPPNANIVLSNVDYVVEYMESA